MYESAMIFWTLSPEQALQIYFSIMFITVSLNVAHCLISELFEEIRNDCGNLNFRAQMNRLLEALTLGWLQGLIHHLVASTRPR